MCTIIYYLGTNGNIIMEKYGATQKGTPCLITVVEHDVAQKIGAIFDFCEIQIDHNQKTGQALERIEAKVEVLQLETSSLRRIK